MAKVANVHERREGNERGKARDEPLTKFSNGVGTEVLNFDWDFLSHIFPDFIPSVFINPTVSNIYRLYRMEDRAKIFNLNFAGKMEILTHEKHLAIVTGFGCVTGGICADARRGRR